MGSSLSHNEVRTGSLANALSVVSPMNRCAARVMIGITWAPASTRRRATSTALYAAMPPLTPRTMRLPASGPAPSSDEPTPAVAESAGVVTVGLGDLFDSLDVLDRFGLGAGDDLV